MKWKDLVFEVDAEVLDLSPETEVLIVTSKQLLPNATYEFEMEVENGRIILSPTIIRR